MIRGAFLALSMALLFALTPSVASACGCLSTVRLEFPSSGAEQVSTRPDLVIHRATGVPVTSVLRAASGQEVALVPQGIGTLSSRELCGELAFLLPAEELAPNTTYELVSSVPAGHRQEALFAEAPKQSFTTGPGHASTPALGAMTLIAYAMEAECGEQDVPCGRFLQVVRRTTPGAAGWLRLTATDQGTSRSWIDEQVLHVDDGESCVEFERFDARGAVAEQGTLCHPAKCARLDPTATSDWNNCTGAAPLPSSAWALVPDQSCGDVPPTIAHEAVDGPYELRPAPTSHTDSRSTESPEPADAASVAGDRGCSTVSGAGRGLTSGACLLLVVLCVARRRRPRS